MDDARKRRVLFLSSWYPSRILPKNGNFVRRHAQAVARYAEVASLHVISDENASSFEVDARPYKGVYEVIVYYPKSAKWRPDKKYTKYLEAHRLGYAHILEAWGRVDITHLNVIYPAGLFALELKEKYNIPYIITEHWTAFLKVNPYVFKVHERYMIKRIGKGAAAFCPVSDDLKNALIDFGLEGPFHTIPNVVDTDVFAHAERSTADGIKILHVSTFKDEHKNISGLLRVIGRLSKERNDFHITMVGNKFGDQYDTLIQSLDISDDMITILPVVPLEDIAQMMREQHLFVLFSNYENLPCVISEAHCTGMVVVGSDVGGTREMISDGNGYIVEARDEEALYEKLSLAMDNYGLYNSLEISRTAALRYGYDPVGMMFLGLYQSVLGG
jgi:glycosyltransferase involved in cell wall biosynthesis